MLGKPKLAFNFDGGSPAKLTIGATGGYRMTIDIHGLASHAGGAPAEGVSAIAIASLAIADLVKNGWHGQIVKGRHVGTSNVGVIHGGEATNVVTDHVQLRAEARSHDPKFRQRIVKEIERAFERAARAVRNTAGQARHACEFDGRLDYESFRLARDEPCVVAAMAAVRGRGARAGAGHLQRRPGRQLAHRPRHSDRDARLRPAEHPHRRTRNSTSPSSTLARRIALRLATAADSL